MGRLYAGPMGRDIITIVDVSWTELVERAEAKKVSVICLTVCQRMKCFPRFWVCRVQDSSDHSASQEHFVYIAD